MSTIDPVQLEIIRNALVAAAEEMSVTIWRTSRSTVVRDLLDFSTAVFDAEGRSTGQAARMPVHLNSMASGLRDILAKHIPLEEWCEGDVVLTNDPYSGGQHLPDFLAFKPVFLDGRRIAIAGALVHHLDVGGGAPGSYHPRATEIFQEGLRIPPLKLVEAGRRNEAVFSMLLANTREPENVGGDFASQIAALEIGVRNLERVGRRYGADLLARACEEIQAQSERTMRGLIKEIPDGTYEFEDFVDDDGIDIGVALRIHAQLHVSGDEIEVDLSGSSPQAKGPVNCTYNMTDSAVVCGVLMSLGRDVPANAGCYRPIRITAPEGTCVNARSPAPVANRMATGHRIVNAVMGAFAQALPDRVPAAYYGVSYTYALNAIEADGSRQVYFELECGGWGGHPEADGASGFSCGFHNISNAPVEMLENGYPVTFQEYGLAPDTGGAGRMRGGLGLVRSFRVDSTTGMFVANLDRFRFPPYGLAGGEPGASGRLTVTKPDGEVLELASKAEVGVVKGDIIRLQTSGGGGHGLPANRSPQAIESDVENGYITRTKAREIYGAPEAP
ncbi:MAG: hydantoinase B/oxoprolinase family protein [Rhodospirillaceae bacterium]|jgi:N-methylhydantoinase B|nr:hydantoinase B/oxoprolinase family protein [Rhodospirillaceae bacterium]